MKGKALLSALVFTVASTLFVMTAHASNDAIKTMAQILSHVNHFPSAAEKETLNGIANDANNSAHIRAIATAMANMQHSVNSSDKAKLKDVLSDGAADQHTKDMATILINFSHTPSDEDVSKLHAMMK